MKYFYENRILLFEDEVSIYENKDFNYLAHWHMDVELTYVIEGSIYVSVNNNRQLLKKGDLVVCSSGDIHHYESLGLTSKVILLVFKPEVGGFSANMSEALHLSSPFILSEDINSKGLSDIKNILCSIMNEKEKREKHFDLFIKARIIEICGLLLRYQDTYDLESKEKTITNLKVMQKVLSYIDDNYINDITLEEISKKFNIDIYNLSKKINAITGTSFRTYVNSMRVLKAETMILSTDKTLTEIAMECGFNSIRTFNRAYKKIKGCVPSSGR